MYHGRELITHHGHTPRSQHRRPWSNMVGNEKPWFHGQPLAGVVPGSKFSSNADIQGCEIERLSWNQFINQHTISDKSVGTLSPLYGFIDWFFWKSSFPPSWGERGVFHVMWRQKYYVCVKSERKGDLSQGVPRTFVGDCRFSVVIDSLVFFLEFHFSLKKKWIDNCKNHVSITINILGLVPKKKTKKKTVSETS